MDSQDLQVVEVVLSNDSSLFHSQALESYPYHMRSVIQHVRLLAVVVVVVVLMVVRSISSPGLAQML